MFPALEGPTSITVNPVGVGEVGLLRDPQVKTCGYSRLTPCRGLLTVDPVPGSNRAPPIGICTRGRRCK